MYSVRDCVWRKGRQVTAAISNQYTVKRIIWCSSVLMLSRVKMRAENSVFEEGLCCLETWKGTNMDMIWYDMIWYDMIWYDMIWYDIWYDVIWYDGYDMIWWYMMWCDMIWYDIWCDMIWYGYDIWYDVIWYDIFVNCNWVVTRWQ